MFILLHKIRNIVIMLKDHYKFIFKIKINNIGVAY